MEAPDEESPPARAEDDADLGPVQTVQSGVDPTVGEMPDESEGASAEDIQPPDVSVGKDAVAEFYSLNGSGCVPGQGAGNVVTARRIVSVTIGTGYPVGGDTSWMEYDATAGQDYTTTLGMAHNSVGHFQRAGTKSIERSFGFNWDHKTYRRSYRVNVRYVRVAHYFDRCPGSPPYYSTWKPRKLIGTTSENQNIPAADFNHCHRQGSSGTWYRVDRKGKAYSHSTGVKIAGTIGIDLSSVRRYNNESKLGYHVSAGKYLCGNNNDPSVAGKVMESHTDN